MSLSSRARFWFDLAERTAMTFLQAFAAVWIVTDDLFTSTNLGIAATAGAIAAGKCLIATKLGNNDDASALPAAVDPATAGADSAAAQAVAGELRNSWGVEAVSEHAKLAAMGVPAPAGPVITDGTLEGYAPAKTVKGLPAKKAAAKKR